MAPKVLVSDKLSETAVQIFRDRGIEVDFCPIWARTRTRWPRSSASMTAWRSARPPR